MKITLQELNFSSMLRHCRDFYNVLDDNRERLQPYFFWAGKQMTANFPKTLLFITGYILSTKYKYAVHKIKNTAFDIPHIILNGNKVAGMIGLDKINPKTQDAEVWYWVSGVNEGKGVASSALKQIENYSIDKLNLNSLYACVVRDNEKSKKTMQRNDYHITDIKYGVPISQRNPRLVDMMHYRKVLSK